MATTEEPILSRIDRLDNMLRQLEEIRGCNRSPKSSCASTPTNGSDGHVSSIDFSPKSLEKHCRPIENVMMETEVKGTMIERLNQVEDRMLKLEEEWVAKRKKEEEKKMNSPKKGFKQLVKQCMKARGKHDNKEA
ncbi:Cellulose synthase family protein isoform 1 [Spatholobus suberectus]|nr:Cellulose synthase family protein isoform 1 [Spatholobus suberectus]